MMFTSTIKTKLGFMRARASDKGLYQLDWQQTAFAPNSDGGDQDNSVSRETVAQISAYFAGDRHEFTIPLDLSRYAKAKQKWLTILSAVPYGHVITYEDYAKLWGNKRASRVAGNQCAANPLPLIIPCHRIISKDGKIENYGGGDITSPKDPENIKRKQWLIDHEQKNKRL